LPTKGLTLPFISYGGNSLIISSAMFGFVLRCAYPREVYRG
jgi:cell division protein FtsW